MSTRCIPWGIEPKQHLHHRIFPPLNHDLDLKNISLLFENIFLYHGEYFSVVWKYFSVSRRIFLCWQMARGKMWLGYSGPALSASSALNGLLLLLLLCLVLLLILCLVIYLFLFFHLTPSPKRSSDNVLYALCTTCILCFLRFRGGWHVLINIALCNCALVHMAIFLFRFCTFCEHFFLLYIGSIYHLWTA